MRIINMEGKKDKKIPYKFIEDGTELIPGMRIAEKKKTSEVFVIVFIGEGFRDPVVVCLDDCGHTILVKAWDGNHVIIPTGSRKVRIAYGKSSDGDIKVSDDYYYNVDDFKSKNKAHFLYVEALLGTLKFIEEI